MHERARHVGVLVCVMLISLVKELWDHENIRKKKRMDSLFNEDPRYFFSDSFFLNMAVGRRFSLYWTGFVVWSRGMFIGYDID